MVVFVHERHGQLAAGSSAAVTLHHVPGDTLRRLNASAAPFAALAVLAVHAKYGRPGHIDQKAIGLLQHGRHPIAVAAARMASAVAEPGFVAGVLAICAGTARRAGWRAALTPGLMVASGTMARRRLSRVSRPGAS